PAQAHRTLAVERLAEGVGDGIRQVEGARLGVVDRQLPPFALARRAMAQPVLVDVLRDLVQPSLLRLGILELLDPFPGAHEGLLGEIFGFRRGEAPDTKEDTEGPQMSEVEVLEEGGEVGKAQVGMPYGLPPGDGFLGSAARRASIEIVIRTSSPRIAPAPSITRFQVTP